MIKLKSASGRDVYINPHFISTIEGYHSDPVIKMSNGTQFIIKERLEEILDKLSPFVTGQVVFTTPETITPEDIHRKLTQELREHGPRC